MLYGAHVSSAGGISTAIDRAEELGCDAVQIFTQSPRMWKPTEHSEEEVARFRARREEAGVRAVVCHALYLVNLAGADREMHKKSVTAMQASLETARAIGADGVVFHVGSHLGKGLPAGYRRAVPALRGDDPKKLIPVLHGALLKNEQDVHLFEQLVFLNRRAGR